MRDPEKDDFDTEIYQRGCGADTGIYDQCEGDRREYLLCVCRQFSGNL